MGALEVYSPCGLNLTPKSVKGRAALAMVLLSPNAAIRREKLAGTLWAEKSDSHAKASLRQCIRELRSALNVGCERLKTDGAQIAFDTSTASVDLHEIVALADPLRDDDIAEADPTISALDRGKLLDGDQPDECAFDDWVRGERMNWETKIRLALDRRLQQLLDAQHWQALELTGAAVLRFEPTHEKAHRALLHCYRNRGDYAAAQRQYRRLTDTLNRDLGVAPSPETQALFNETIATQAQPLATSEPSPERARDTPQTHAIPITVLPFFTPTTGNGDAIISDLGRGISTALIAALSRFKSFVVISSSFPGSIEKDIYDDPRDVIDALAIEYYVKGRVRTAKSQIRISVELIRAQTSEVIWADQFDGTMENIFDFEDEVASNIAGRIDPCLLWSENRRLARQRPTNLRAYEHVFLAVPAIYRSDKDAFHAAGEALKEAIQLDPQYSDAYAWRSFWCMHSVGQGWSDDQDAAIKEAAACANRAIALEPTNATALALSGHVESFLYGRVESASRLLARSIEHNPNSGFGWALSAVLDCYLGLPDSALEKMAKYRQLCPFDPNGCYFHIIYSIAYTLKGEYQKAIEYGAEVLRDAPNFTNAYKPFVVSLWHSGQHERARATARRLLELEPSFTVTRFRIVYPFQRPQDTALYEEAFSAAGIPMGENNERDARVISIEKVRSKHGNRSIGT